MGTEHNPISFTRDNEQMSTLLSMLGEISDLEALQYLAGWDQETQMPEGASEARAAQSATLEGLVHDRWTSPRLGELLDSLGDKVQHASFTDADRGLVFRTRHKYDRETKLPRQLVEEMGRAAVFSQMAWIKARANNDFASFAPHLEKVVGFAREVADRFGYKEERYDALLDVSEPGMTARTVERLFAPICDAGTGLLQRIQKSQTTIDASFLEGDYSLESQKQLSTELLKSIGYDFNHGYLAISAHPFTTSFGSPYDVRVTTRYSKFLPMSMMASLHEGGHALYEQGVSRALARTPIAHGTSGGVHESQSRLWENAIGRSEAFWQGQYHLVQETFPEPFKQISISDFVRALNQVKASLIRVEADEATYNLHIIIRFELERAMLNGDVSIESLPRLWNEKYRAYLGVEPESDSNGVLQDMHWSGWIGSFPSYTLGNLYGAQIYSTLRKTFPDLDQRLAGGETAFILTWLRENIYQYGSVYQPKELIQRVTGEEPNPRYLVDYLTEKFSRIYNLS